MRVRTTEQAPVLRPGNLPDQYNGVPFRSDFKLAGTFPLPYDVTLSATLNSLPGRVQGDLNLIDETLPLNWLITRGTTYADGTLVIRAWCSRR